VHQADWCFPIAHSLVMHAKGIASEAQDHVVELARWLSDRPNPPTTPQGRRARLDRVEFLARWCKLAQKETRP